MKRKIIMDCDPGHDDAIALILAFASSELEIIGVTTVAGNQTVEKTTLNAMKTLSYIGASHIPIAKGAAGPLMRKLEIAPQVHGDSGLDGPVLPEPIQALHTFSAVELMHSLLLNSKEPVTIVATAALTNVASLLLVHPEIKSKIKEISLMGGGAFEGNWSPSAEFNILVDPEAASIVFQSGIPIIMAGLDVTHKALISPQDNERFRTIGNKTGIFVAELLDFFLKFHLTDFKGSPLHDPCAVAYLIAPEIFTGKLCHVAIETKGEFTLGETVVDINDIWKKEKNAFVLLDIERDKFVDLLVERIKLLP